MEKEARKFRCAHLRWTLRSRSRRSFHSGPSFHTSLPKTPASGDQATSVSDYRGLIHILDACKHDLNFTSAAKAHATIAKVGYETDLQLSSTLVSTYVSSGHLNRACQLLDESLCRCSDVVAANMVISTFMKKGQVDMAKRVFVKMPRRDVVSWNSVIGGCVKNGHYHEGVRLFKKMLSSEIEPDQYTFSAIAAGCAHLGALAHAEWMHSIMTEKGIALNHILHSALISMYAKCGKIEFARDLFQRIERPCVSSWNALINGIALHGPASEAISVFRQMEDQNILPDARTFVGILTACSHCGLVEEGKLYFEVMWRKYHIEPQLGHYGALVDLLSRVGRLEEAYATIRAMPMKPDVVIWKAFLSACQIHRNFVLGKSAFKNVSHLESGDYILLSNAYSSMLKWNDAALVRDIMRREGARKDPGKSWVEIGGTIYQFKAGDRSHPEMEAICKILECLVKRAKLEGYVHATELVLMDVSEEEKEDNLTNHSEKIAAAFLVLKTCPQTPIRITKNLRTCCDCHHWFKILSRMLNRSIIVRDRIRFHRFELGSCSCGDFW